MKIRQSYLIVILALFLGGCSAKNSSYVIYYKSTDIQPVDSRIELLATDDFDPVFLGKTANLIKADAGHMAYSGAAGVVGFAAQIAAHSMIVDSSRSGAVSREQEEANKILEGYPSIESINLGVLLGNERSLFPITSAASGVGSHYVQISPVFYVSQDRERLELHAVIEAFSMSDDDNALYRNVAKTYFQSSIIKDHDIHSIASDLYVAAVSYAVQDMNSSLIEEDSRNKSYDFDGGFERGKKLSSACDHLVIRNLRGWIVADISEASDNQCNVF